MNDNYELIPNPFKGKFQKVLKENHKHNINDIDNLSNLLQQISKLTTAIGGYFTNK